MTAELVTQAFVEAEIQRINGLLEKATHEVRKRGESFAEADTDYDVAFSKAFLLAKDDGLTDQAAKARATVLCEHELRKRNATHVIYESAREAGRNFREQMEGWRSVCANLRPLVTERGAA